ncbi:uncharacterized protein F4807DRAFT_464774 [Annulohypoxylon truncatum]|uniref:uncharacterized protein n=1 Tax=Annulohypoxylon truncatum TaxID=327061 RepID=UPI0020077D14|nr:uncharacterized protein F4807DRAFT_464774 [Annulohypoxylon truncatum]KAI1205296.1 hypothetical protein F4807DRAFT_464774 [Annulohypoxylon truncatum]
MGRPPPKRGSLLTSLSSGVSGGLEVAPEAGLPHVVEGPTIVQKPHDDKAQYTYEQQPQAYPSNFYQNNLYPNGAYPPTGYAPSSQPAQSQWGSTQSSAYLKDGAPPSGAPPSSPMILGIPRRKFWLIFAPLIALLVIGLAVGLGAGLGTSHKSSSDTPSTTAALTPIVCPNANGTTYQATGEDPFLIVCDVDYSSNEANSGTTDIGNTATDSIEDCIDVCSNNTACVGAGWGSYEGTNTCWMKGTLGSSHEADNWYFAIKQQKSS